MPVEHLYEAYKVSLIISNDSRNHPSVSVDGLLRRAQLFAVCPWGRFHVLLHTEQGIGYVVRQEEGDLGDAADGPEDFQVSKYHQRIRLFRPAYCDLLIQPQTSFLKCQHEGSQPHVLPECRSISRQVRYFQSIDNDHYLAFSKNFTYI